MDKAREKIYKMCEYTVRAGDWYGVTNRFFIFLTKEKNEGKADMSKILDEVKTYKKTLDIPTVKEIKKQISDIVGRKRPKEMKYSFGKNKPVVATQFLIPILEVLDNPKVYYDAHNKPIFFVTEDALAILLPIIIKGKVNQLDEGAFLTEKEKIRILGGTLI